MGSRFSRGNAWNISATRDTRGKAGLDLAAIVGANIERVVVKTFPVMEIEDLLKSDGTTGPARCAA